MTLDADTRAAYLAEMGLGPQWVRRSDQSETQADPVTLEAEVDAAHPPAGPAHATDLATAPRATPSSLAPASKDDAFAEAPSTPTPAAVPVAKPAAAPVFASIARMGWDELEQTVSACTRCGLCEGRTKTAFGVGDRKARWLFIGEGPGREEDLRGEPFVGPAGQLLDNMLAAMKLARGRNTYIANIVKCRPTDDTGKDRRPSADETAQCLPYLERQIALIQPDVIVTLGKTAAVSLLGLDPETSVASLRGKVHRYAERPMIVTYHPAYLLRTPADKKKAWADLCLAMAEYDKLGVPG